MMILSSLPVIKRTTEEALEVSKETANQSGTSTISSVLPIWCIILLVIMGVLLITTLVVMIILIVKQKKKIPITSEPVYQEVRERPKRETPSAVVESHSNHTQKLWSSSSSSQQERNNVLVRDIAYPERFFKVSLDGGVVIGRTIGDVILSNDRFVSSKHCELSYSNGILYVQDLGSANGTFYENQKIQRKTAIINGGIVKVGETELKIEVVKEKC